MNEALVKGQFGPFRQVWLLGGMGALVLSAAVKFLLVDRAPDVAGYAAIGGAVFAVAAGLAWTQTGTFSISRKAIQGRRRMGAPFEIPIADIRSIETGTNKLPRLLITHTGGTLLLKSISARLKAIDALRSLKVPL
jgi:hypothetical protein